MRITNFIYNMYNRAYNYAVYGHRIGKVANNGSRAFRRGKLLTGLDRDGNVLRQIVSNKIKNRLSACSYTSVPGNDNDYILSRRTTSQHGNEINTVILRYHEDIYGNRMDIFNEPWSIYYTKDLQTGKIRGHKLIRTSDGINKTENIDKLV